MFVQVTKQVFLQPQNIFPINLLEKFYYSDLKSRSGCIFLFYFIRELLFILLKIAFLPYSSLDVSVQDAKHT
jgi:hypothetical protein